MALSESFLRWEEQHLKQLEPQAVENVRQRVQEEVRQQVQGERQEIALNLLRKNLPLDTIAEATGLEIAQLQQLRSQLNP
ncbi:MAG: hypothetical protein KME10_14790 [Plectolyngbya sp. WJT66-NPBG17]|jgi:cytochrome P450|nr:hypothetical protein [Plectolyngbya sp. WJT66-NPBG17]MBW4527681.1 hypothetical protein [Phormidium tanganyikae FI6-MK23]